MNYLFISCGVIIYLTLMCETMYNLDLFAILFALFQYLDHHLNLCNAFIFENKYGGRFIGLAGVGRPSHNKTGLWRRPQ